MVQDDKISLAEIAWELPLTEQGKALVGAVTPGEFFFGY
jgi:hypothetical protein